MYRLFQLSITRSVLLLLPIVIPCVATLAGWQGSPPAIAQTEQPAPNDLYTHYQQLTVDSKPEKLSVRLATLARLAADHLTLDA